jgi:protein-S-isoprenylcysteine O-methyltransferase Ste14
VHKDNGDIQKKPSYPKLMLRGFLFVGLTLVAMFVLAGRISYWQGWVFAAVYVPFLTATWVLFRSKQDLIRERLRPGPGVKWWDKIFFALYVPASISIVCVAGLDAGRFAWTGRLPAALYIICYVVMILSFLLVTWAMWTNKFFSRAVRIQTDRGHYVVQNGPYRFVRHPGYLGGIFALPSMALVLGSLWALVPAGASVILILVRTYLEDATLRKELAGYADYAQKVKSLLLPKIW